MTTSLAQFSYLYFDKVIYPRDGVCPLVFLGGTFFLISFSDITNSLIHSNHLRFLPTLLVEDKFKSMDKLKVLIFEVYFESMSETLLNRKLFYNVNHIKFDGLLSDVANEGLFLKRFEQLNMITLALSNMREFFHKGTKWIELLNGHVYADLNKTDINLDQDLESSMKTLRFVYRKSKVTFDSIYSYPREDFCLFKSFPHANLVMPIIMPGARLKCTCTLKYLQMYLQHVYAPYLVNISAEYQEDEFEEIRLLKNEIIPTTFLFCSGVIFTLLNIDDLRSSLLTETFELLFYLFSKHSMFFQGH